jgi:hypothetical protein
MKKQLTLRKGIEQLLITITTICIMLIMTTIESDWTKEYLLFLIINSGIVAINVAILKNYGKSFR